MKTTHEQIKESLALDIATDAELAAYCRAQFGRPPLVIVNRYGDDGFPGESVSPFVFLCSDGENELGDVDEETFEVVATVGACDAADSPTRKVLRERTDEASGLVVSGIADRLEAVRGMVERIVRKSTHGACFRTAARTESSLLDWPLEWAQLRINYFEPETLDN